MKKLHAATRFKVAPLALAIALPTTPLVFAQDDYGFTLEEVVVTARRKDESLQDVPQTVNAVGADTFQELNILNFEDMENVVAGVSLGSEADGYSTSATMRGISFDIAGQTAPAVEFYLNDAPVESNQIFTQVFDIGQVEVLRGPQGTVRGRSAPSGAITVRTREANLSEFGGYLNGTMTNQDGSNYQGAINVPLIEDKLGLRLAGVIDENDLGGTKSVFDDRDQDSDTKGFRATLGFAPTDNFDGSVMHQRIRKKALSYSQVSGFNDGSILGHHAGVGSIDPNDRLAIASATHVDTTLEATTLNLNWLVVGHELSYVGQYGKSVVKSDSPEDSVNWIDTADGNTVSYFGGAVSATSMAEWYQDLDLTREQQSHEIRITPDEPINDFFSYTVGVFYQETEGMNYLNSNGVKNSNSTINHPLAGTIPTPFPDPDPVTGAYISTNYIERPSETDELSAFVNGTFYLTHATELSLGARHIHTHQYNNALVGGSSISEVKRTDDEVIWNVALSHRFNDDYMMYANVGTAVRPGPLGSLGINPLPNPSADMTRVLERDNERSTSYELGFKWDFMNGRGRLNAAYYYQDFDGYLYYSQPVQYFGTNGVQTINFTTNADTVVEGIDIDVSFQILPNWNISSVLAWNDSELKSDVPCNDPNVTLDATNQIAFCDTGKKAGTGPDWSASVTSEYYTDVSDSLEGYVRGIYSYYPENDNQHEFTTIDNYGLLNLFVGVRDNTGVWDIQLFAKNILGEEATTSFSDLQIGEGSTLSDTLGDSGYHTVQVTPRREVGVSLRYNFGG